MNAYSEFLQRDDCILLVVDVQKVMFDLCVESALVQKNTDALIQMATLLDIPVLFSVHNSGKLGGCLPELLGRAPGAQVLDKLEFSCFENEPLARAIGATGRRTLLLAGIETHVCIFHTGASALRLGYRVHVARDAVSSRSAANREVGLNRLEKAGAVVSSTEMVIYELLNRAGTPEFRAALPLLKTLS